MFFHIYPTDYDYTSAKSYTFICRNEISLKCPNLYSLRAV